MAHVADVKALKEAFKDEQDIHTITASQIFDLKPHDIHADHRRKAKVINFGNIIRHVSLWFGQSTWGFAS